MLGEPKTVKIAIMDSARFTSSSYLCISARSLPVRAPGASLLARRTLRRSMRAGLAPLAAGC